MMSLIAIGVLSTALVQDPVVLEGKPWIFVQIDGKALPELPRRPEVTFEVSGNRVSGNSGVNGFAGSADYSGSSVKFGNLMMTMMAGSPVQMEVEQSVVKVMGTADGWRRTADYLELTKGGSRVAKLYRSK